MELFKEIVMICGGITTIGVLFVALIKPLREWIFGTKAIRKGQQCLLRQQMLEVYYKCRESRTIRQYRYENFTMSYHAYKALGGNSFIDKIKHELKFVRELADQYGIDATARVLETVLKD